MRKFRLKKSLSRKIVERKRFGTSSDPRKGEKPDMTTLEVGIKALQRAIERGKPNEKYLDDHLDQLTAAWPGKFVVIAGGGEGDTEGTEPPVVKPFASRAEARDFCDELDEDIKIGAVIWYLDKPSQAFAV